MSKAPHASPPNLTSDAPENESTAQLGASPVWITPGKTGSAWCADRAEEFQRARARLVGKNQGEMGALFKVMGIADRKLRPPPGFQPAAAKSA